MIKFLLNGDIHTVENLNPNTTVLSYLRENLHKTGTKEGCAAGDCGACTVVVGELDGEGIRYTHIMSCIALLPTLHGKQLITVEDLKHDGQLHPVQEAMVEYHGSQCGFCTPGFIMSMFALRKNHSAPTRQRIEEELAGNLCRCTGYRPIIDAAVQMYNAPMDDQFTARESETVAQLKSINTQADVSLEGNGYRYFAPTNSKQLSELLLQYPDAHLLAGGTDLGLEITQFLRELETIIYVGNVADMCTIEESDTSYKIGAAVTYTECVHLIEQEYPDFAEIFERLGSTQVRNVGTVGGNVGNASPIGDTPPALIALNAKVYLRKGDSERVIPAEDYFVDYKVAALQESEFIHAIEIPKAQPGYDFRMYKISKRLDDDISASCGAFLLKIEDGRVADVRISFGGLAGIPKRAGNCEKALAGQPWNQATIDQAKLALAQDFTPLTDVRASAAYRLQVSANLLQRCFLEIDQPTVLTRVTHYA